MESMLAGRKTVFLDRDGVLNDLVDRGDSFRFDGEIIRWTAPFNLNELRFKSYVREALELIQRKGYLRILVTNQPDLATGQLQSEAFEEMMAVVRGLPLTDVYVCPHHPKKGCSCRKPAPGMLLTAKDVHGIDMSKSYMIGDMETDVMAGRAAGVQTILVTKDFVASSFCFIVFRFWLHYW